jgi:diacylglycerol O-acyltransferase / wax synthase
VPGPPAPWQPASAPSPLGLGLVALRRQVGAAAELATQGLLAARDPLGAARQVLGRAVAAVSAELSPAPPSFLNPDIGPRRRLVRWRVDSSRVLEVKRQAGVTFNDTCLALAAGALRRLALERGEPPLDLKVAVPVSLRGADTQGWGNRISFAAIDLPVESASPLRRVSSVHEQTQRFKEADRAASTDTAINSLLFLPGPLRTPIARLAASARAFNLTISNVPGPRTPLYLLGAELDEGYLLAPLTPGHALSIAFFPYRYQVFFAGYADPEALPEVGALPDALEAEMVELTRRYGRSTPPAPEPPPTERTRLTEADG